jgi:glycosyltransferase involved in cell wall biosynthesis
MTASRAPGGLRIGVDGSCWANRRGYGRFTRELVRAMVAAAPGDEFTCFVDEASRRSWDLEAPNVRLVLVPQSAAPTDAASADGNRSPADILRFSAAALAEPMDVFFSPSIYTFFPLPPRLRAVITIHDAIAERFPELTLPSRRARLFWRAKVGLALMQARLVLTVSEYAAGELVEVLGVPRPSIRVAVEAPAAVYHPATSGEVLAAATRLGLPAGARWFTYVGGFSPHKRVDAIVRAHADLARALGPRAPHLLLVGATSGDAFLGNQPSIRAAIEAGGTAHLVHWTGFLSDEALRPLHTGALALLLPSLAEGFGLPAVEAAACGAPVIATTASPLPQLLEGGGVFVAPGDDAALGAAMRLVATDEAARARLAARALERAGSLTWDRAAAAALGALREAAS